MERATATTALHLQVGPEPSGSLFLEGSKVSWREEQDGGASLHASLIQGLLVTYMYKSGRDNEFEQRRRRVLRKIQTSEAGGQSHIFVTKDRPICNG